ncbi:MAG TPA: P-loop NTPase [Acidimicrobiales bacterium]|nr:P-loop NTPase [Acidimicrobiales bacterium]
MAPTNDDDRLAAAAEVEDPVLFHRLGDLGTLVSVRERRGRVEVALRVPHRDYPGRDELERRLSQAFAGARVRLALEELDEDGRAELGARLRALDGTTGATSAPGRAGVRPNPFAQRGTRTRVLAVASGKGGVGKSSVTVNLAVALAGRGRRVGVLDADIYGFSVPRMLGVTYPPLVLGRTIVPPVAHGVRVISMGFFVGEDQAVAWRGPMLHKALEQFLVDVHWGAPDFLVVDLPPGTGDVALSIGQQLPGAELYLVTTPQPAAQRVAQRAGVLARQLKLPVRGVIENLSWFTGLDGTRYELFGRGGGEALAEALGAPLLARIPLEPAVREGADAGEPAARAAPGGEVAAAFDALAARVVELGPVRVYRSELTVS